MYETVVDIFLKTNFAQIAQQIGRNWFSNWANLLCNLGEIAAQYDVPECQICIK